MAISNLQALANIGANLGEIAGIGGGTIWVLGSWIPTANKCPGFSKRMILVGVLLVSAGLLLPVPVNYLEPINEIAAVLVSWAGCIPIVVFAYKAYILPGTISTATKDPHGGGIFFLALLGIVCPFHLTWYIALFMATHFAGKKDKESTPGSDDQKSEKDVVEEV